MRRVIAVAACGVLMSACSSWVPSLDFPSLKPAPAVDNVEIRSDPPGADARTATGTTCRTPCTLGLPVNDSSISVALNGYVPQTVPVQAAGWGTANVDNFISAGFPHLTPNPVVVKLEPVPPPPPVASKPAKKAHVAEKKKPALAQSAPPPPPTLSGPSSTAPWPSPR